MPKINAQVPFHRRKTIRSVAKRFDTTVQAVTGLALALGLRRIMRTGPRELRKILPPDGRRNKA